MKKKSYASYASIVGVGDRSYLLEMKSVNFPRSASQMKRKLMNLWALI